MSDIKGLGGRVKGVAGGGHEGVLAEAVDGIVKTVRAAEGGRLGLTIQTGRGETLTSKLNHTNN